LSIAAEKKIAAEELASAAIPVKLVADPHWADCAGTRFLMDGSVLKWTLRLPVACFTKKQSKRTVACSVANWAAVEGSRSR